MVQQLRRVAGIVHSRLVGLYVRALSHNVGKLCTSIAAFMPAASFPIARARVATISSASVFISFAGAATYAN